MREKDTKSCRWNRGFETPQYGGYCDRLMDEQADERKDEPCLSWQESSSSSPEIFNHESTRSRAEHAKYNPFEPETRGNLSLDGA